MKYADLSVAHDSEYTFDLDRMVSLTGNTGPYLQYAAARIRSILRRARGRPAEAPIVQTEEAERELMLALLGFGDVVASVGRPSSRTGSAPTSSTWPRPSPPSTTGARCSRRRTPEVRASRLRLCALTLAVLEQGLALLGIAAPERM